jgi:arsenite methyltransferase
MTANLYESKQLQRFTGKTIRPGGLFLTEKAVLLCRLKKGDRVLDVGCGAGATVAYLKDGYGLNAFGLDLSPSLLRQGRTGHPDLALIRGDATGIPVPESIFQAVFCECVLSLIPEPSTVLDEFYRVLMPGGFLVLTDIYQQAPHISRESSSQGVNCCLNGAIGKDRIQDLTARRGFNIFLWEDHTPLLKALAAQIVFACGSMEQFRSSYCRNNRSIGISGNNSDMKPGYFLLAAKKAG